MVRKLWVDGVGGGTSVVSWPESAADGVLGGKKGRSCLFYYGLNTFYRGRLEAVGLWGSHRADKKTN